MFGANSNNNPFGGGGGGGVGGNYTSTMTNLFGKSNSNMSKKSADQSSGPSSGLFGMPPVPLLDTSQSSSNPQPTESTIFGASKPIFTSEKKESNLFQGYTSTSSLAVTPSTVITTTTTTTQFGENEKSLFGKSSISSSSNVFGAEFQKNSSSSSSSLSLFGKSGNISNPGNNLFGKSVNNNNNNNNPEAGNNLFGKSGNSQLSENNLFGKSGNSQHPENNLFGKQNSNPNSSSTENNLFANANPSFGNLASQESSSGNLFKNSNSVSIPASTESSSHLFSKSKEETQDSSFLKSVQEPVFGKSTQGSSGALFGKRNLEKDPKGLFGASNRQLSSNVFGTQAEQPSPSKVLKRTDESSSTLFGKREDSSNFPSNLFPKPDSKLFGKPLNQDQNVFSSNLFGKSDQSQKFSKIFNSNNSEDPKPGSSKLFEKKETTTTTSLFVNSSNKLFGQIEKQEAGSNLFRKKVEESGSTLFGRSEKPALFGKPASPIKRSNVHSRLGLPPPPSMVGKKKDESSSDSGSESVTLTSVPNRLERLTSKEELENITSIICEQVPEIVCKKPLLLKHFSRFGKILKMTVNPAKFSAVVHFSDHKSAKRAKEKGAFISSKIPKIGAIFYSKSRSFKRKENPEGQDKIDSLETESAVKPQRSKVDRAILSQQTHSDQDRYEVLEARNKLLRDARPKRREGDPPLRGNCPDMCPETERYSRTVKNQLRSYEKLNGCANHAAMVKEYSRSSADQDVPLSLELRPGPILMRTMDHILCNVIDRIENNRGTIDEWYQYLDQYGSSDGFQSRNHQENVGEWFEFVWSITRGIRKDVTQQQLTDPTAVLLVEKCARFHIVCAERLVEEDSHDFSRKLNDENLTKCLQTLKHMYYDLSLESISCPNEPEFRAYEILMNMNDGDTLRQVQNLDPKIRESDPVKFVLKIFNALNNNNYVRFFKLVKRATLLQGCILLRYFHQVRSKALETIVKAYCPTKTVVQFTLSVLMKILGFEDENECDRYCRIHGLEAETEFGIVYMEKSVFQYPPEVPAMRRSFILIENKRNCDWSEVINGGPLAENPYLTYKPKSSFDDQGFLKPEAFPNDPNIGKEGGEEDLDEADEDLNDDDDEEREDGEAVQEEEEEEEEEEEVEEFILPSSPGQIFQQENRRQHRKMVEGEACETLIDELVDEVCDESFKKIGDEILKSGKMATQLSSEVFDEMTDEIIVETTKEALKECRNEEIRDRLLCDRASEWRDECIREVTDRLCLEIAEEEMKIAENELKTRRQLHSVIAEIIAEELITEYVEFQVKNCVSDTINDEIKERKKRIDNLTMRREQRIKRKFLNRWKSIVRKAKRRRDILENFPPNPAYDIDNKSLINVPVINPSSTLSSVLKKTRDTEILFKAVDIQDEFLQNLILQPTNLASVIGTSLPKEIDSWKLLLCIPDVEDYDSPGRCLVEMIKRKLNNNNNLAENYDYDYEDDPDPGILYKNVIAPSENTERGTPLSICVRLITRDTLTREIAYSEKKRKDYLSGSSGILFLHLDGKNVEESRESLHSLLRAKPPVPPIPLYVLRIPVDDDDDDDNNDFYSTNIEKMLDLKDAVDKNLISSFDVERLSEGLFDVKTILKFHSSLKWLSSKCPPLMNRYLTSLPLRDFVDETICDNWIKEVYSDLKERRSLDLPHQDPKILIDLFNSVVDYMIEVIKNPKHSEISWPIPEFDHEVPSYWNDDSYLDFVTKIVTSLKLPDFKKNSEIDHDLSWRKQCESVFTYFDLLRRRHSDGSSYLSRIQRSLLGSYDSNNLKDECFDSSILPWTDVIHSCIDYQISILSVSDPYSTTDKECMISYLNKDRLEFKIPSTWKRNVGSKPERNLLSSQITMNRRQLRSSSSSSFPSSSSSSQSHQILKDTIKTEMNESLAFEAKLSRVVSGETLHRAESQSTIILSDEHGRDDDDEYLGLHRLYEYVPIVSYLSPSLGSAVSPVNTTTRLELISTGKSPRRRRRRGTSTRNSKSPPEKGIKRKTLFADRHRNNTTDGIDFDNYRRYRSDYHPTTSSKWTASKMLDELRSKIKSDEDENLIFERKLRNAVDNNVL